MEKLEFSTIETNSPKSWHDFQNFYSREFNTYPFLEKVDFRQLPFEMQLGIFLKYFTHNGVELDICNTEFDQLPQTILDAFKEFEKVIAHYS